MQLTFGLQLDDQTLPRMVSTNGGTYIAGPRQLLTILERYLGLLGQADNIDYLRIEQFRQALIRQLSNLKEAGQPLPFYARSFEADPFATAEELLSRRDELKLAGWNFQLNPQSPLRLNSLAAIEQLFQQADPISDTTDGLSAGYADRFCLVLEKIKDQGHPFTVIYLNEPLDLLPSHFQRLFQLIQQTGNQPDIQQIDAPDIDQVPQTDLDYFKYNLQQSSIQKTVAKADGSLLLIKAKRSNEAAAYLAQLLRLNPEFRPACLIPEKNRTLDMALIKEGLPSLGILSASLARPALQILKLAPTFLWHPVDPFKMLEFVSLAIKPLPDELAAEIARQVARTPGLKGDGWFAMTNRYFSKLEEQVSAKEVAAQRKQYEFWFDRKRYPIDRVVPKREVIQVYDYIREWAFKTFEENGSKNQSLVVLSEQAKRIVQLLQTVPEPDLGYLALERIVRTIYEPSPVTFQEKAVGHLPFAMQSSAFIAAVPKTLWWNFVQNEPPHFFSRWYPNERDFLKEQAIHLDTPTQENARQLWQRNRPVLQTQEKLLLVIPEVVDGVTTLSHPLLGDLEATFKNLEALTFHLQSDDGDILKNSFNLPPWVAVENRQLGKPKAFLQVGTLPTFEKEYESLTSLESLFYYPYQWFFKYKIKLTKSTILSVVKDQTLMGNLAHRIFEKLLKEETVFDFDKNALEAYIDASTAKLLSKEGAVLLMYGREPERVAFTNKIKYAAWSLINFIRENNWTVLGTEMELNGQFPTISTDEKPVPVKGIADLILTRGTEKAIVDLKWRGASYRTNILKNKEDLQLVLYAKLLDKNDPTIHTAYFIIESGKMIARNNAAFKSVVPVQPDGDIGAIYHDILTKMEATWKWRQSQFNQGTIEIRTRQTVKEIEEKYSEEESGDEIFERLEMKGEDAKWDDYRTLINMIE